MAIPAYIQKTLYMKPEVKKIFEDLEAWLDHCRIKLLPYNPADLYKSKEYRDWQYRKNGEKFRERKPYLGKNPRPYNERISS
jgi:hypothetical protein